MIYLIFGLTFFLGAMAGAFIMWGNIKRYRKALGLPEDPFDAGDNL